MLPLTTLPRYVIAGLLFAILATANAAGYRYGTSDQAFYVPAVTRALNPDAFPRDASLIEAQAHLMMLDEMLAATVRFTGLSTEAVFLAAYVLAIALTWVGLLAIGTRVYASPWAVAALGAAFTMRHRIPRTSANTFEPFFHPRMLAFALGMMAIGAILRRRSWWAVTFVALAAVVHITTGLWFSVLIGAALAYVDPTFRKLALAGAIGAIAALAWAASSGPLQGMWTTMDSVWLQAVASKDSLFADQWPAWAWASNLGLLLVLWLAHTLRVRRGHATREDTALVWGATALVALFLATLPLVAARLSLVVEFQISRVFWLVDLLATVYAIAVLAETRRRQSTVAPILAGVLVALSVGRGVYVMTIEHPERSLVALRPPASPWEDAMAWLSRQPVDTHVLADPGHGWKYGTSVRVSAGRDVMLEEVKDSALAIYSRAVAGRVVERTNAIGDFGGMTAEHAQVLATQYDLDVMVTQADLPLPVLYRNTEFRIYALRSALAAR